MLSRARRTPAHGEKAKRRVPHMHHEPGAVLRLRKTPMRAMASSRGDGATFLRRRKPQADLWYVLRNGAEDPVNDATAFFFRSRRVVTR